MSETVTFNPIPAISSELQITPHQIEAVLKMLSDSNTVPFIARYRKEATGDLDEIQIRAIEERNGYLVELESRRQTILGSIEEQGKLSDDLKAKILSCETKATLEDLYLPYKPKRRTRATIAKEKGLGPLAERILAQPTDGNPRDEAKAFINEDKEVADEDSALAGARDIVAETVAENANVRAYVREEFSKTGILASEAIGDFSGKESKFSDYYDYREAAATIPSHRFLAIRRGEREGVLRVTISVEAERIGGNIERQLEIVEKSPFADEYKTAIYDSFKRLLSTSVESDLRIDLKMEADRGAVDVFASNLRNLLMAAPYGTKRVIGVDPGLRTGCKCAALDDTGKFLDNMTFNIVMSEAATLAGKKELIAFIRHHNPQAMAVGNGTGGRETEKFIRSALKEAGIEGIIVLPVSEAGASVYSASEIAGKEFPKLDLTIRGAISIARRLQDPLAELVKIEPKSIGVGQYQHDVHQPLLSRKLNEVIESCVNQVGVELNTASAPLLSQVAGIGPAVAQNIVEFRENNGAFSSRKQLLDVSKLGPRTFEQAAGFLRIRDGENPLDKSSVHPERYKLVQQIADDMGVSVENLVGNNEVVSKIDTTRYRSDDVGSLTLKDIVDELKKPGRDPRDTFEPPAFRDDVNSLEDLKNGMHLEGVVTNVTAFGAFVDVGVHQDGLVHISQLSDQFVKNPSDVVKVGDKIKVHVLDVDLGRQRISLSAKSPDASRPAPSSDRSGGRQNQSQNRSGPPDRGARGGPAKQKPENFSYNPFADLLKK